MKTARDLLALVLLIVTMLCWSAKSLGAQEKVMVLGVAPTKCEAPCTITVRAVAKPDKDFEKIVLVWANVLENDANAGTRQYFDNVADMTITEVPRGYYTVQAILYRKDKSPLERDVFVAVGVEAPTGRAASIRFGMKGVPP